MITCIKREFDKTDENGRKWWRCILTASEEPGSLTLSGADVDDLNDEIGISAGSVLITPSAQYVFLTDGQAGEPKEPQLVSITVSPEISTMPPMRSLFPLAWEDLTEDEQEGGKNVNLYATAPLVDETEYTITVTPCADWYLWDRINEVFLAKGEVFTYNATVSEGWLDIYADVANDNVNPTKWIYYNLSISNEAH